MEILYITSIVAIVVLCMALLFAARRVLRSSPLSSGELALAGISERVMIHDALDRDSDDQDEDVRDDYRNDYEEAVQKRLENVVSRRAVLEERVDSEAIMATWVPTPEAIHLTDREMQAIDEEMLEPYERSMEHPTEEAATSSPVNTVSPATAQDTPAAPATVQAAEMSDANAKVNEPVKEKRTRVRKPLPPGYKYGLECLLLGVSVLVLVATQRGAFRSRSLESHRVA